MHVAAVRPSMPPGRDENQSLVPNRCMIHRRLLVLRMVASCGTVTGAAESLRYTPSWLSVAFKCA